MRYFILERIGMLHLQELRKRKTMQHTLTGEAFTLLRQGEQEPSGVITEADLRRMPEVMQRYLRYARVVGKEVIRTVYLRQQGFMRTQPGQKWLPLVAKQYYSTMPPAFIWYGTMQPLSHISISATDRFTGGHGNMRIKLLSVVPLGNARGPEMDQGELQRYLGEMVWFPTAWLSPDITWQALDAGSVRATLSHENVTASIDLHIDEQGQLTHVTAERYKEEHGRYVLAPWSVQAGEYQEVQGMRIPTSVEVIWHLPAGDFSWFRCKITEIAYNQLQPHMLST